MCNVQQRQMVTIVRNFAMLYFEAPAAANNKLVGKGNGIAVDATSAPVPHFWKKWSMVSTFRFPNLLCRKADPALRAILNVK